MNPEELLTLLNWYDWVEHECVADIMDVKLKNKIVEMLGKEYKEHPIVLAVS